MDENSFCTDGRVEQKEIKEMARYSYSDLKDVLKDSRGMVYLKKMEKASSIDETFRCYNSILNSQPSYEVLYWKNSYIPVLNKIINTNILRLFKESANPSVEYLIKSLVNLRGDYNQMLENLIKEANNKNLSSDEARMKEVLDIKRKYEDAWKKMGSRNAYTEEAIKLRYRIAPLLEKMNSFGYIHTQKEKESISYYELNKTENILRIVFAIIGGCLIGALFIWAGPLLLLFGLFIGALLLKCMR
jgi:hypothetical protein